MSPRTATRSPLVVDEILDKDPGDWDEEEHRFLQDRDALPAGVEKLPVIFKTPAGDTISNDAAYFAAQQLGDNQQEAFESRVEERARALAAQMVQEEMRSKQNASGEYHGNAVNSPPKGGTKATDHGVPDDTEDDEDETEVDYRTLHMDALRAECSRRGLSVEGNKPVLVQRLEEDDENDEDQP